MKKIFFNSAGLRAGWRLLIFVAIFVALSLLVDRFLPLVLHLNQRSFLDPVGLSSQELQGLIEVVIATWIMARIERRRFRDYGIPVRNASRAQFLGRNYLGPGVDVAAGRFDCGVWRRIASLVSPSMAVPFGISWDFGSSPTC